MERMNRQPRRINPEDNVALGLQMLKTRLDNTLLTRLQRTEFDEIISMIARHTGEVVNERALLRTLVPDSMSNSGENDPEEEPKKKKKSEEKK